MTIEAAAFRIVCKRVATVGKTGWIDTIGFEATRRRRDHGILGRRILQTAESSMV